MPAGDAQAVVSSTTTLLVALFGLLGVTVPPIVVAFINRGAKPTVVDLDHLPDVVVKRSEYDQLLEQLARLDDECDRLTRENVRLREHRCEDR